MSVRPRPRAAVDAAAPVPPADLRSRVVRSAGWVAVEKWGVRLASLGVFIVLGRLLAPSDIGLVALAMTFTSFLGIFVDNGFSQALVQRRDLDERHSTTAFWIALTSSCVLAGGVCAAAPFIAHLMSTPRLATIIMVLSLGLPLSALSSVPSALLQRDLAFRALAVRRLVGTVAGAAAGIGLAFGGAGAWAMVGQVLTTSTVGVVVLWNSSPWRPSLSASWSAAKDLWAVSVNVLGIEMLNFTNSQADKLLVGTLGGPAVLGYYYVGSRIVQVLLDMVTSVTGQLSLTTFSRIQDDMPRVLRTYRRFTWASAAITFPVFSLSAALAPQLIPLAFGDQWGPSIPVMQWLALSAAITAVAWFDKGVLMAVGRPGTAFFLALGQTVLGLALLAAAVPLGIVAVAASRAVRQAAFWPVRLLTLRSCLGVPLLGFTGQLSKPVIAAVLPGAAIVAAQHWNVAPASPLAAVLLLGGLGALGYVALLLLLARSTTLDVLRLTLGRRTPRFLRAS